MTSHQHRGRVRGLAVTLPAPAASSVDGYMPRMGRRTSVVVRRRGVKVDVEDCLGLVCAGECSLFSGREAAARTKLPEQHARGRET